MAGLWPGDDANRSLTPCGKHWCLWCGEWGPKRRKLRIHWTCSNFAHHSHRWRWTAAICGALQRSPLMPLRSGRTAHSQKSRNSIERCSHCNNLYDTIWQASEELWGKATACLKQPDKDLPPEYLCIACFTIACEFLGITPYWSCQEGRFPVVDRREWEGRWPITERSQS